jgi:hypothetical protein
VLAQIVDPSVPHHCGINKASPTRSCFGSTATASSPFFADPTGFGGQRRNQFTGPGYFNTDFTVEKGFKVPGLESGLLQIGVEAYNVLNHPNFLNPDTNFSDQSGFGVITENRQRANRRLRFRPRRKWLGAHHPTQRNIQVLT